MSALILDAINAPSSMASVLTFTRASTATRYNAAGVLETVVTNAPRFDYDPLTGAPRGLLIEEARTNLLLNSATLSTQSVTVTAQAYTLSFFGSGTVTLSGASTAGPLVGSGAFPTRSTLTVTPAAGTLTLTVTGDVQYAQLEAGSFPTSYIPTTSAAATRAAEVVTILLSDVPGWNAAAFTLVAECEFGAIGAANTMLYPCDGTSGNQARIVRNSGGNAAGIVASGGVAQAIMTSAGVYGAGVVRAALAVAANDFALAAGGVLAPLDTSGIVPAGMTQLRLGSTVAGTQFLNGWLRRVRMYTGRLPNAQLQGLTA